MNYNTTLQDDVKRLENAVNKEFYFFELFENLYKNISVKLPLYVFDFDNIKHIRFAFTLKNDEVVNIVASNYLTARNEFYNIIFKGSYFPFPYSSDKYFIKNIKFELCISK